MAARTTHTGGPDLPVLIADPATGLTTAQVAERRAAGLANAADDTSSRTFGNILRANLFTLFNLVIAVGAVVLLALGRWQDALFSLAAVANVIIGVTQEFSAKRKLDSLALMHASHSRVVRDGTVVEVPMGEIVRDDIVELRRGDQVPADGPVVATDGIDVDESLLTGESDPIAKHVGDQVLSGAGVAAGSARFRAVKVGADSYASRITSEARRFSLVHSELRSALDKVVRWISWILIPLVALVLNGQIVAAGGWTVAFSNGAWQDAVVRTVASVSASVPQGLILMTSIAFAVAAVKLSRSGVLTQELAAVEGLARVDVVCLDKTGTLTEGQIVFDADEALHEREGWRQVLAWIGADEFANPTAQALGPAFTELPDERPSRTVAFSSARRWSSVSFADGALRGTWVLGAPDAVLEPARADNEAALRRAAVPAAEGIRVLVLAYADAPMSETDADAAVLPTPVTPIALVSFREKVRDDARATLAYFAEQGVGIRVLSGDHPATVGAVAREVGIPLDGDAYDARTLPTDTDALADVLEHHQVFARVSPQQKQQVVLALQSRGHTVAMTGDGVNDALALKTADLGIAMGNGAAATKAVARLVLLDGKFSHLPDVVREGRQVIANIERVSRIFLTKTVYAFSLAVVFGVLMIEFPLLPRQFSATDGLTIGIPAFFLALMPNPRRYVPGFLGRSLRFCVPSGVTVCLSLLAVTLIGRGLGVDEAQVQGAVVIALTVIGLWVLGIQSRPLSVARVGIIIAMIAGLVAVFTVPLLQGFFLVELPTTQLLAIAVGIAVGACVVIEIVHQVLKRRSPVAVNTPARAVA